jgi:surface antigen
MTPLAEPAYGCIVTFTRKGGGHVGFVVGATADGKLLVLGGNQGNTVSIAAFDHARVTGYFWPSIWNGKSAVKSTPNSSRYQLPTLAHRGVLSSNEA